ncbi:hypothetical protein RJ639_003090 [Escallonia herrerae]|uniref:PGG domain-containing protein n=1 Tax=Escallonia herrerae TaxID=1293975 RepID=A0AA88W1V7_9ASTE|nr:hypothetical protein RJ639_003090 [Escallonia herrerae]
MATNVDVEKHLFNTKCYDALMRGEEDEIIKLCREVEDGPLHIITTQNDTILHLASSSKSKHLVRRLLNKVKAGLHDKLVLQNDLGNTILHEAANAKGSPLVDAASDMLRKAPHLLHIRNNNGETALFRAAYKGKGRMFYLLDSRMDSPQVNTEEDRRGFHVRNDGTSTLHVSILVKNYDLAHFSAKKYGYLAGIRDEYGMTPIQLLATNPQAFRSRSVTYEDITRILCGDRLRNFIEEKLNSEVAWALAKFMIERGVSWENTGSTSYTDRESFENAEMSTLMLATKSGNAEIVEEILRQFPNAVENVDGQGRNILHVAILYHHIRILDIVEKMEFPMTRLVRKLDNDGNSILHMVGMKATDDKLEDMQTPALLFRENLFLFEHVNEISNREFIRLHNTAGQTAEELFEKNNAQLRKNAKEWLKCSAENSSIVAVLTASAAFAAAFTVPGGSDEATDIFSLMSALTSILLFLTSLTSPFGLKDFKLSLSGNLMIGTYLLGISISNMMLAFIAAVLLVGTILIYCVLSDGDFLNAHVGSNYNRKVE